MNLQGAKQHKVQENVGQVNQRRAKLSFPAWRNPDRGIPSAGTISLH